MAERQSLLRRSRTALLQAIPVAVLACPSARAQCTEQWTVHTGLSALGGAVYTSHAWDPDGPGPLAEFLVFGGPFTTAGGVAANHVAAWSGEAWIPLGAGTSDDVYALETFGGDLVAGGYFAAAGGIPCANIARWDGAAWHPLGSGIPGFTGNLAIADLDVYAGELVAAGRFAAAGGVPGENIARWNGAAWQPLGSGLPGGDVQRLAVAGGQLIAGAAYVPFTVPGCGPACAYIARWDGASWQPLGTGLEPYFGLAGGGVMDLGVLDGGVVATGAFAQGGVFWTHAARYDGTAWTGLQRLPIANWYIASHARVHHGRLHVSAETDVWKANAIFRWSGQSWEAIPKTPPGVVFTLGSFRGRLVAAGVFPPLLSGTSTDWVEHGCACYADCDNSGSLAVGDFGCFQTQFVAGHPYADCTGDNALTVADFGCFQNAFVAGCP